MVLTQEHAREHEDHRLDALVRVIGKPAGGANQSFGMRMNGLFWRASRRRVLCDGWGRAPCGNQFLDGLLELSDKAAVSGSVADKDCSRRYGSAPSITGAIAD